jgi:hypothetical protein
MNHRQESATGTHAEDLRRAAGTLEWPGVLLPQARILGRRINPVVAIDLDAHAARAHAGVGPMLDHDTLTIWEWPQSRDTAPASPLQLIGVIITARSWRRGLSAARDWRGFGRSAVLLPQLLDDEDEAWQLEFAFAGVGLLTATAASSMQLGAPAATTRQYPARRRVLDRWVEETLYAHAIAAGQLASL